jgi:hypothetical protein
MTTLDLREKQAKITGRDRLSQYQLVDTSISGEARHGLAPTLVL